MPGYSFSNSSLMILQATLLPSQELFSNSKNMFKNLRSLDLTREISVRFRKKGCDSKEILRSNCKESACQPRNRQHSGHECVVAAYLYFCRGPRL